MVNDLGFRVPVNPKPKILNPEPCGLGKLWLRDCTPGSATSHWLGTVACARRLWRQSALKTTSFNFFLFVLFWGGLETLETTISCTVQVPVRRGFQSSEISEKKY